ncbi:MAG: putative dual-specificity RNA methyltransferase RlmN [Cyclobacteriaceae bacterium]|nr:MAG: putative dual-specificity RNA methyltransferase RlmN [Cyclobacteriaceae bacterium]
MPSAKQKVDIRNLSLEELIIFFENQGEKAFRGRQVYQWLWEKSAVSFGGMTNLSEKHRSLLNDHFVINPVRLDRSQVSNDRTIKSGFKLHDDHLVEGVLIPTIHRMTACVSSQVGCSLSCKFCATGYMDRARNLDPGEIYDQVVHIRQQAMDSYQKPLTNIVFMGMGEPLLNYQNVLTAIDRITSPRGLGMSSRRITVSTAGIAKMIKKLGADQVKFNLALSLHAANDEKRSQIMPINESNSLKALEQALRYFYQETGNELTFEYIVFNNFNDTLEDAKELLNFTRKVPSKVNLIEYNPIEEADYVNTGEDRLKTFAEFLENNGVNVRVRYSRGKDIDAACGQLANKS